MKRCPFEHQRHGSPREFSPDDGERLYLHESLVFAVLGVEMRGTVISEIHSNDNSKESRYFGHFVS